MQGINCSATVNSNVRKGGPPLRQPVRNRVLCQACGTGLFRICPAAHPPMPTDLQISHNLLSLPAVGHFHAGNVESSNVPYYLPARSACRIAYIAFFRLCGLLQPVHVPRMNGNNRLAVHVWGALICRTMRTGFHGISFWLRQSIGVNNIYLCLPVYVPEQLRIHSDNADMLQLAWAASFKKLVTVVKGFSARGFRSGTAHAFVFEDCIIQAQQTLMFTLFYLNHRFRVAAGSCLHTCCTAHQPLPHFTCRNAERPAASSTPYAGHIRMLCSVHLPP